MDECKLVLGNSLMHVPDGVQQERNKFTTVEKDRLNVTSLSSVEECPLTPSHSVRRSAQPQ